MTLREEISKELGLYIDKDGWDDAFKSADIQGKIRLDPRVRGILLVILKRLEIDEQNQSKNKTPKSA